MRKSPPFLKLEECVNWGRKGLFVPVLKSELESKLAASVSRLTTCDSGYMYKGYNVSFAVNDFTMTLFMTLLLIFFLRRSQKMKLLMALTFTQSFFFVVPTLHNVL